MGWLILLILALIFFPGLTVLAKFIIFSLLSAFIILIGWLIDRVVVLLNKIKQFFNPPPKDGTR
jgi:hypothetical protein